MLLVQHVNMPKLMEAISLSLHIKGIRVSADSSAVGWIFNKMSSHSTHVSSKLTVAEWCNGYTPIIHDASRGCWYNPSTWFHAADTYGLALTLAVAKTYGLHPGRFVRDPHGYEKGESAMIAELSTLPPLLITYLAAHLSVTDFPNDPTNDVAQRLYSWQTAVAREIERRSRSR